METAKELRNDLKKWQDHYEGKDLKIGQGGLSMLILILRVELAILDRLEASDHAKGANNG